MRLRCQYLRNLNRLLKYSALVHAVRQASCSAFFFELSPGVLAFSFKKLLNTLPQRLQHRFRNQIGKYEIAVAVKISKLFCA